MTIKRPLRPSHQKHLRPEPQKDCPGPCDGKNKASAGRKDFLCENCGHFADLAKKQSEQAE